MDYSYLLSNKDWSTLADSLVGKFGFQMSWFEVLLYA